MKSLLHVFQLIVFFSLTIKAEAQPSITPSYSYLYSKTFDQILQTYNTSRPWQTDKLIPLTNGYGGKFGWNWRIQKTHEVHLLPELSYNQFFSTSENFGQTFKVGFHQFNTSLALHIHPKAIFKQVQGAGALGTRFYMTAGGGFSGYLPFAKRNGKNAELAKDTPYRAFSYGVNAFIGTGFHLMSIGRFVLTPELAVVWFPTAELTNFAEVVNGHNQTKLSNEASNLFLFQFGIRITYIKAVSNWWDKPRTGDKT
jgi:hypothetical protein